MDPATLERWWLGLPVLGNILSMIPWFRLLWLPAGTIYDKSGPAIICLFVAAGTFLLGLCVSAVLFRRRKFGRGLLCAVFSLTPLLVGLGAAFVLGSWRGITLPLFQGKL
jgi:hypothetical protein